MTTKQGIEAEARACLDELTRQLLLERRFRLLAAVDETLRPVVDPAVATALGGRDFGLTVFPPLEPLYALADRVLVRADELQFTVAVLRLVQDGLPPGARLPLEVLVQIGGSLAPLTGIVRGGRLPVAFLLYEVHTGPLAEAYRQAVRRYRRRGVRRPRVAVLVAALDAAAGGRVWVNAGGAVRLVQGGVLRRAWRERHRSERERARLLERRGLQPERMLLGGVLGAALGTGAALLGARWGVTTLWFHGTAALLASVAGALVSLASCRVCDVRGPQAAGGGALAMAGILGAWSWLDLPLGLGTVLVAAAAVLVSAHAGSLGAVEPVAGAQVPHAPLAGSARSACGHDHGDGGSAHDHSG